jgi:hypothetical protein
MIIFFIRVLENDGLAQLHQKFFFRLINFSNESEKNRKESAAQWNSDDLMELLNAGPRIVLSLSPISFDICNFQAQDEKLDSQILNEKLRWASFEDLPTQWGFLHKWFVKIQLKHAAKWAI